MFLGSSESLGNMADGFEVLDSKAKIFQKQMNFKPSILPNYSGSSLYKLRPEIMNVNLMNQAAKAKKRFLEDVFDQIMCNYLPPSVVIDDQNQVLHTINDVSSFLSIPVGEVSLNVIKMLSKEMSIIVSSLIRRAEKNENEIVFDNIESKNKEKKIAISCKKITDKLNSGYYFLVSFDEKDKVPLTKKAKQVEKVNISVHYNERIDELEKELQLKTESLHAAVEELETSNEELQSSNEELMAANEELQSTNEELQSVNEELYTVNNEHIRKIEELSELTSDFENLLKNTQIGTLFLDQNLTIRKVNIVASTLTNILTSDINRPLQHLSLNNLYENFLSDIEKVSDNLQPFEREIQDNNANWYIMRVIPYRNAENAVEGIMITFVNITKLKQTQGIVSNLTDRLENALEMGEMSWWEWDYEYDNVKTGKGKYTMLGYTKSDIGEGMEAWTKLIHPDDYNKTMTAMKDHLEGKTDLYFVEYRVLHKNGNYIWYRDKGGIVIRTENGKPKLLVGIVMNITREK
jgi:two-component system CheB/CheR fusion protein